MNDNMTPSAPEQAPLLPNIDVKVFPSQEAGKLLATANVTLGNCFTIKGLRVYDTEKGLFVSMPSVRGKDGNFHDVCHPTTKEMREALNAAVIGEYHQAVKRIADRGQSVAQRPSVREALQNAAREAAARPAPAADRAMDQGAR